MKRLIIIPAYNESAALPQVLERLTREAGEWDVLVIDDCSTDDTHLHLDISQVRHLHLPFNTGIGGAMHAGYAWAAAHDYDRVVQIDADGQHRPDQVASLDAVMDATGAALVIGSRFLTVSSYRPGAMRLIGIRYFSWLIGVLTKSKITDPTSGFRLADRRALTFFANDYPSDYPEPETVTDLLRAGLPVVEIPTHMNERQGGESSITPLRSLYYMIKVSTAILLNRRKTARSL